MLILVRDAASLCFLAFSGRDRAAFIGVLQLSWPSLALSRQSLFLMSAAKALAAFGVEPWTSKSAIARRRRELSDQLNQGT